MEHGRDGRLLYSGGPRRDLTRSGSTKPVVLGTRVRAKQELFFCTPARVPNCGERSRSNTVRTCVRGEAGCGARVGAEWRASE